MAESILKPYIKNKIDAVYSEMAEKTNLDAHKGALLKIIDRDLIQLNIERLRECVEHAVTLCNKDLSPAEFSDEAISLAMADDKGNGFYISRYINTYGDMYNPFYVIRVESPKELIVIKDGFYGSGVVPSMIHVREYEKKSRWAFLNKTILEVKTCGEYDNFAVMGKGVQISRDAWRDNEAEWHSVKEFIGRVTDALAESVKESGPVSDEDDIM